MYKELKQFFLLLVVSLLAVCVLECVKWFLLSFFGFLFQNSFYVYIIFLAVARLSLFFSFFFFNCCSLNTNRSPNPLN